MKNNRKNLAPGTLLAPVPPAMVTVGDFDNANVLTIGWTGILNSTPPRTYVSIRPSRHSHGILMAGREFVINLPSVSQAKTVDYVGIYTGAKLDKFEKCPITKQKSHVVAPPTIAECPIALECKVYEVIPMGSHDVFLADIVNVSCREDLMDEKGKIHFENADLLAYSHGEYYSLGEVVGRFGFSTDKPEKKTAKSADSTPKKSTKKDIHEDKKPRKTNLPLENPPRPFYADVSKMKPPRRKPTDKNKGKRRAVKK